MVAGKYKRWGRGYLDAMKGVMSNSSGKETYVVIFRRSLAECSNRWGAGFGPESGGEKKVERGGTCLEQDQQFHHHRHNIVGRQRERRLSASHSFTR